MTTPWPVYLIAASQIIVLYGLAAPASLRLLRRAYAQRNPEWLATQPALQVRLQRQALPLALFYGIAALWLGGLVYATTTGQIDQLLPMALLLPALGWVACEAAVGALDYRRIGSQIPLAPRRHTTLQRRTLSDFAPPASLVPGYGLLVAIAAIYSTGYGHELIDGRLFGVRLASLLVGTGLWISTLRYCVRRKRNVVDDTLGPAYRRAEVIATIVCLYVYASLALLTALQDVYQLYLLDSVTALTCGSVLLQAAMLLWIARVSGDRPEPPGAA